MDDGQNDDEDRQTALRALAKVSCPYCGTVITAHQILHPGHCGAPDCFTTHIVKGSKDRETLRTQDYAERQEDARTKIPAQLAQAAKALGSLPQDLLVAVVPYQNEPMEPLQQTRRAKFEAHLGRVVHAAFDAEPGTISLLDYSMGPDEQPAIVAAGCAACQGSCCKRGGGEAHALLTPQTVYHMRQNDPDLERETVIDHYMEALPATSVRDSCVYQGPQGCVLERKWRSSSCNTFHCHDLHAMHDLTNGRTDVPLAIVGINDDTPGKVIAFDAISGATTIETP